MKKQVEGKVFEGIYAHLKETIKATRFWLRNKFRIYYKV